MPYGVNNISKLLKRFGEIIMSNDDIGDDNVRVSTRELFDNDAKRLSKQLLGESRSVVEPNDMLHLANGGKDMLKLFTELKQCVQCAVNDWDNSTPLVVEEDEDLRRGMVQLLSEAKEMLSYRVERNDLQEGDMINTWKTAYSYDHHGIYVGENFKLHFSVLVPVVVERLGVVISLIDQERDGEKIDRALLKNVLDVFVDIGMGQMDYYENDFEASMIMDTTTYFSWKASNWILDYSCFDYMMKDEECLRRENNKVSHLSTETKLLEKVQHKLLSVYATQLLQKELLDCHALLEMTGWRICQGCIRSFPNYHVAWSKLLIFLSSMLQLKVLLWLSKQKMLQATRRHKRNMWWGYRNMHLKKPLKSYATRVLLEVLVLMFLPHFAITLLKKL